MPYIGEAYAQQVTKKKRKKNYYLLISLVFRSTFLIYKNVKQSETFKP